ncbi:amidinotransferase [Vibrio zhanjiangensis]|uniref:Amidinotransferase n=1 Tax=Vibrio zhanjiangensis TaxID=1046128 RepID=A0ABQ6EXQ3_9VIBR|nr:hypothetical protein [Vibrio zhanjiangensis]GLT17501.1 amidinotransferase [Vibrio zhanjiangensis]
MSIFTGSHNEWDQLEEVIVGSALHANKPTLNVDQVAIEYRDNQSVTAEQLGQYSQKVIEETEEDLALFVENLQQLGIKVRRPEDIDQTKEFSTGDWSTTGFYNYCPRDSLLVVGDKIIETPMTMRCRFLEQFSYKNLMLEYFEQGANWLSAPKPRLLDNSYNLDSEGLALNNIEPVFDAANILRAGEDLFYLISDTGNEKGAKWLQTVLGDQYRVHLCRDLYDGIHIDSTMALLRPGLMLLNPARVNENNLPEKLRSWDKIWCPDLVDTGYEGYQPLSSTWVGMNIFMLSPTLAVVDSRQETLIKELEKNNIEVLQLQLRHARTLGGGFHCVTLDVKRKSKLENYF